MTKMDSNNCSGHLSKYFFLLSIKKFVTSLFFAEAEKSRLLEEAKKLAKEVDTSVVRLCFQAFVEDEQGLLRKALQPVYSNRIYDQSKIPSFCISIYQI